MRTTVIAIIVFFLWPGSTKGQQALNPDFLQCAVYVSFNPTPKTVSSGTGFLVWRPLDAQKGQVFLVTNKHVLPKEGKQESFKLRVAAGVGAVQEIDIPIVGADGKYLPTVSRHKDEGADVAAVNITDQIIRFSVPGKWLEYDLFVTRDQLLKENISVGDEVFLLGYPDAIYDPRNVSPVARSGIIATVPAEGFAFNARLKNSFPELPDQLDGFLIDANVYPGSSGSLVILKQQSLTIDAKGDLVFGVTKKRPYLLGVVSGSIPINDRALRSRQRMGLGVVHSASVVRDTIDQQSNQGTTLPTRGVVRKLALDERENGRLELFDYASGRYITWNVGKGAPSQACVTGNLYTRSDGGTGSTFYVCENSAWVAK